MVQMNFLGENTENGQFIRLMILQLELRNKVK